MDNEKIFNEGMDEFKDDVAAEMLIAVKHLTGLAMSTALNASPEPGKSDFSSGVYITNFNISQGTIDKTSNEGSSLPADPYMAATIKAKNDIEMNVKKPFTSTFIANSVGHVDDVEYGLAWPVTPGYLVFEKTKNILKEMQQNYVNEASVLHARKK